MRIQAITGQKLSLLLADFQMCRHCRVVDRNNERLRVGYACPECGQPGHGGHMYFELSVHTLINLMQEAFHAPAESRNMDNSQGSGAHDVSVVLFFCALREVLINGLIGQICWAQKIPKGVYTRLLSDNKMYSQRRNNLLPSLVGKNWTSLIKEETASSELDYVALDTFLARAASARNRFMHEGKRWDINHSLAEGCLENIWPLLNFYVALHNRHVYPFFKRQTLS